MRRSGPAVLVATALVAGALSIVVGNLTATAFYASPGFTITSSISSSSSSQISALLYPGTQRYLWYTAHNPQKVPITVRSMSISSVSAPRNCPVVNLDASRTTFAGALVVPPHGTSSAAVPVALIETHTNQNACQRGVFRFQFVGSASYTEVYATATSLTSSDNPSLVGQVVTYTASVLATAASGQDPVPSAPTGTVTFRDGTTVICSAVTLVSTGPTTSRATCTPPTYLVAGNHPITAAYTNIDLNFTSSTSPVLIQVVRAPRPTSTILTSSPNPSVAGAPVTLVAHVLPASGVGTPTGTVNFYVGSPTGAHTLLGVAPLGVNGRANLVTTSLAVGHDTLYAVYGGDPAFSSSVSPPVVQVVLSRPGECSDTYTHWVFGDATSPTISAPSGNDFFYLFGANFHARGGGGDDCYDAGDGDNTFTDGDGHDRVFAGNGHNTVTLGNGGDHVLLGNGTNVVSLGNGNDTVTLGNGSKSTVTLGGGSDAVTLGSGSFNSVTLGAGADVVTLGNGSHDAVVGGTGGDTVYLGSGVGNSFVGSTRHTNVCHLPAPPSTWHGAPADYYHDTITNCSVVTP